MHSRRDAVHAGARRVAGLVILAACIVLAALVTTTSSGSVLRRLAAEESASLQAAASSWTTTSLQAADGSWTTNAKSEINQNLPANMSSSLTSPFAHSYRPIFFMHGFFNRGSNGDKLKRTIEALHPGTLFTEINLFEDWESFDHGMWTQVKGVRTFIEERIEDDPEAYGDGFNLICHSQGGVLCRGLIADWDNHKVRTFVSLAGVQQGVDTVSHPLVENFLKRTHQLYSPRIQARWSIPGWFKDMQNYDVYRNGSLFLAEINNESPRKQPRFQENFAALRYAIFLGSPADGSVTPWQSTVWGYYALGHGHLNPVVVPYSATPLGKQNLVPLQGMLDEGKAVILQKDGVKHKEWLQREDTVQWYLEYLQ